MSGAARQAVLGLDGSGAVVADPQIVPVYRLWKSDVPTH
jgi:hypothetical protein